MPERGPDGAGPCVSVGRSAPLPGEDGPEDLSNLLWLSPGLAKWSLQAGMSKNLWNARGSTCLQGGICLPQGLRSTGEAGPMGAYQ